jgi:hypothetical protein
MRTKRFRAAIFTLLACASVGLASCSDDDEKPATPTPGGTGGTAGASGSAGSGGTGGSTAGTAGSGGLAGAPTMMCGAQTCTGLPGIPILAPNGIAACCFGAAGDKCGIDAALLGMGCVEKNAPGNPDDTCFANDGGSTGGAGGGGGSSGSSDAATPDASGNDASTSDASSGDANGGTGGVSGASGAGGRPGGRDGGGGREGGIGNVRGCCKPTGVCGILLNLPGLELGCVEIPEVDGGPPPQACTPRGS